MTVVPFGTGRARTSAQHRDLFSSLFDDSIQSSKLPELGTCRAPCSIAVRRFSYLFRLRKRIEKRKLQNGAREGSGSHDDHLRFPFVSGHTSPQFAACLFQNFNGKTSTSQSADCGSPAMPRLHSHKRLRSIGVCQSQDC